MHIDIYDLNDKMVLRMHHHGIVLVIWRKKISFTVIKKNDCSRQQMSNA